MRIDAFLNAVNLTKRRTIAQDMITHGAIRIGGQTVKASREVKIGDVIEMHYLNPGGEPRIMRYQVLAVPAARTVAKTAQKDYVKEL